MVYSLWQCWEHVGAGFLSGKSGGSCAGDAVWGVGESLVTNGGVYCTVFLLGMIMESKILVIIMFWDMTGNTVWELVLK